MDTKLTNLLTWWDIYCKTLPPFKLNDPLITWPIWGHGTAWKTYISILTRIKITKLGSVQTSGRRFSTQTLNPIQPSVVFHIETIHLFCCAKEITGLYMKNNTEPKWVKSSPSSCFYYLQCADFILSN